LASLVLAGSFSSTSTVTIHTRIADPFSGVPQNPGKAGGIFFDLDQDNYVKQVMTIDNGTGKPGLAFAIENNGRYRVPSRIKPIAIDFTNSATLDLFLIGDPATSRVIALYHETSDDLAAIKMIGEVGARSYAWMAKFFKPLIRR
jgi:hypothetical protein